MVSRRATSQARSCSWAIQRFHPQPLAEAVDGMHEVLVLALSLVFCMCHTQTRSDIKQYMFFDFQSWASGASLCAHV